MNTKLKMNKKILTSALMVLFIVSIIPVFAGEDEEVDLTTTVIGDSVEVDLTVTVVAPSKPPKPEPSRRPNKKPRADAGPNVKISVGSNIHFSGADSYDKDGRIINYRWDFGDGTTATGVAVYHKYLEPGHYTVTLIVCDDRWAEDSDKCEVFVWEPPAPVVYKFGDLVPGEQKGFKVNAVDNANTIITLDTTEPVTVTIIRYDENPHPDDPMPANALPIYVDIEVSDPDAVEWPIYVEMFYTDEEAEGLDEDALGIYYWKDGAWHLCSHTGVDAERNVVWAYMTAEEASGSPILAGYTPPKPAEFTVSNLVITPEKIEPGEEVTITFLVTNVGEETGTYTVNLSIEGLPMTVVVTLDGGESEDVELKLSPETEGTYQVEVDGLSGNFTVKTPIIPPKPAAFEVSNLVVSPGEVVEGEHVTVTVKVTNIGEEEGSHTVKLKIDGLVTELAEITLFGGSSTTITFTLTEAVGEYSLEIEGLTAGLTVAAKPAEPINIYLVVGIIICAIAISYMLWRGKLSTVMKEIRPEPHEEKKEEKPEEEVEE